MSQPTIYVTNFASRKPPHRGPGKVWSIMAKPRPQYGELGDGTVHLFVPDVADLDAVRAGEIDVAEYEQRFRATVQRKAEDVRRSRIVRTMIMGHAPLPAPELNDGDTLCCACSRASAAKGECHRVWVAEMLRDAGWRVVLDGEVLS